MENERGYCRKPWEIVLANYHRAVMAVEHNHSSQAYQTLEMHRRGLQAHLEAPGVIELGQVAVTNEVVDACSRSNHAPEEFLLRHLQGDFGVIAKELKEANRQAIEHRGWIVSEYATRTFEGIYVATYPGWQTTTMELKEGHE